MNITIVIIVITAITSVLAFSNHNLMNELIFWPYRIWRNNEWYRVITCGFIHADIGHLFFNMFALYSFGGYMEDAFRVIFDGKGLTLYVFMYFGAICIADTYNLITRKDDYAYRSLGASGGVSAIIFSYILLNPFGKIYMFFIPVGIPAFAFGGLYLFYCAYMAKRGGDNIGHMAHFTGSIFGFIFPILFAPHLFLDFIAQLSGR